MIEALTMVLLSAEGFGSGQFSYRLGSVSTSFFRASPGGSWGPKPGPAYRMGNSG